MVFRRSMHSIQAPILILVACDAIADIYCIYSRCILCIQQIYIVHIADIYILCIQQIYIVYIAEIYCVFSRFILCIQHIYIYICIVYLADLYCVFSIHIYCVYSRYMCIQQIYIVYIADTYLLSYILCIQQIYIVYLADIYCVFSRYISMCSGSLSPRHGASSGCGQRNGLQYGGQLRIN